MIDLKTIALASALLLLIPVGLAQMGPDQLIIQGGFDEVADITDVVIADTTPHMYNDSTLHRSERLVEGHTVFVTIDIREEEIVANGSIDITGFVRCDTHVNATGPVFFGVVVPNRVNQAHEECHVGDRVIVTPDPFEAGSSSFSQPQPTGQVYDFIAPNGEHGYAEEFVYTVARTDAGGASLPPITQYAWAVPILDTWTDHHGREMDFFAPLPNDRLAQMGVDSFRVVHESSFAHG